MILTFYQRKNSRINGAGLPTGSSAFQKENIKMMQMSKSALTMPTSGIRAMTVLAAKYDNVLSLSLIHIS